VTSIEFEHPEFYADYQAFLAAFEHFIRGMDVEGDWPLPPTLILNAGSPGCLELRTRLQDWPGQILTYAVEGKEAAERADFAAYDVQLEGETSFRVRERGHDKAAGGHAQAIPTGGWSEEQVVRLQLPGVYNIENALGALAAARMLGVGSETIAKTLEGFGGTRRRFEIRQQEPLEVNGEKLDVMLVDDYAHHPTAIAATLEAARQRYPGRRLIAVYQPHMYSRTRTFFEQFLSSFDAADIAIISDIFPARERDTGLVHARDLVEAMKTQPHFQDGARVLYGGNVAETERLVRSLLSTGDLIIIMGAGDIYRINPGEVKQ
jgi:UDP-N-acetylmuramate--alanine ligase